MRSVSWQAFGRESCGTKLCVYATNRAECSQIGIIWAALYRNRNQCQLAMPAETIRRARIKISIQKSAFMAWPSLALLELDAEQLQHDERGSFGTNPIL
jgi:hypothetical protein